MLSSPPLFVPIRKIPLALGALLVASFWLLSRAYTGVRHDGILYMGQVLLHIQPEVMSRDLFFAYGSQDSFSVFANVVAKLYQRWGMATTQLIVLLVCLIALMAVLGWMLRPLKTASERWMGLVAVACLSHLYGGLGIFGFAESFITARTVAEPLALASLAALLSRQHALAGVLVLLSALAHPLIGLSALIVGWVFLCLSDRRWLWAGLLALVPVPLAVAGIAPFSGLLMAFDSQWWQPVAEINSQVLLSRWETPDWQTAALDFGLLWLARLALPAALSQLARALLIAGLATLGITLMAADLMHNVLLTGLQPWRVLWLVHLFALAFLPAVLWQRWGAFGGSRLAALSLAAAVLAVNARWDTGWALLAWAALSQWLSQRRASISPRIEWCATVATLMATTLLTLAIAVRTAVAIGDLDVQLDAPTVLLVLLSLPTIALPAAALLMLGWQSGSKVRAAVLASVTLAMGIFGAAQWDRRSDWTRYLESSLKSEHPFTKLIPPGSQVYWHEQLPATWMLLKRASFLSEPQAAGLLFNRQTAMEFVRRRPAMAILIMQSQLCKMMQALDDLRAEPDCSPSEDVLAEICGMERGPDFLVLKYRLPRGVIAQWTFDSPTRARTYYLYDCLKLR